MGKSLASAAIVAFVVLGLPAVAIADRDDRGDRGDREGWSDRDHGGHHSAPEPLTILGLALGAGGVACARWATNRRSRNK